MLKRLFFMIITALIFPASPQAADAVVNISYVKSPFNLQHIVMKKLGLLERELAPLGVDVVWHEIDSGAQQARAMAASSLDVGGVMNTTSILLAQGEGNPIKIAAGVSRPTDIFAVVGVKNGPKTIRDLKGKTVAGPKGTVLHQLLLAALAREGIGMEDINFVQMDIPKAFAAIQSGSADAALLAANALIRAEEAGDNVLARATGLVVPKLAVAVTEKFAKEHPERLKALLNAHDKAADWIASHEEEAIKMGADEQGLDLENARKLYAGSHFTQRFSQGDIASMKDDLEFMLANGMMRKSVDPEELFLPEAFE